MVGGASGRVKGKTLHQNERKLSDGKIGDIFADTERAVELRTGTGTRKERPEQFHIGHIVLISSINYRRTISRDGVSHHIF